MSHLKYGLRLVMNDDQWNVYEAFNIEEEEDNKSEEEGKEEEAAVD